MWPNNEHGQLINKLIREHVLLIYYKTFDNQIKNIVKLHTNIGYTNHHLFRFCEGPMACSCWLPKNCFAHLTSWSNRNSLGHPLLSLAQLSNLQQRCSSGFLLSLHSHIRFLRASKGLRTWEPSWKPSQGFKQLIRHFYLV